jgi:hypothetical protein
MKNKEVPLIKAVKKSQKDVTLDPAGFFVIEITPTYILVEYYSNVYKQKKIVSGKLQKVFIGTTAASLSDTIAAHITTLRPEHYLYLGRELQQAEYAFIHKEKYEQDGC